VFPCARIVSGVVETGVHHHAAFILLAGRTIGATGRRRNVKPKASMGLNPNFTLSQVRDTE
jgi:hypothetical protein